MVVNIRVVPRSSKNKIDGVLGDALKVRLQAPPVEGKANRALIELLAQRLALPISSIQVLSGRTSRMKKVRLRHVDKQYVADCLQRMD